MSNTIPIKKPELIPVDTIKPFTRFCCSIGMIPSSYKASMSYEEQLMWLCHFLEDTLLPTVNTNTESFLEIEALFEQLHDYVEHYFDNLDVQQEINNKLDEMVEDGTLETIVGGFINEHFIQYFDTVADLKNANLSSGQIAGTKGYYSINDGGGAKYNIVNDNTLIDDGGSVHDLSNGNKAKLIIMDNTINFKQLGAKASDTFDCKQCLLKYENICNRDEITYKLYIPNGMWFFSPTLITRHLGIIIYGDTNFSRSDYSGTIILPFNDTQDYIWKIGGKEDYNDTESISVNNVITQSSLNNLTFSTGIYNNLYSNRLVTKGLLIFDRCTLFTIPNLCIMHFNGLGMSVRNSFEFNIDNLIFRNQKGFEKI